MTVHVLHVFDRRGRTLFTKCYSSVAQQQQKLLYAQQQLQLQQQQQPQQDTQQQGQQQGGGGGGPIGSNTTNTNNNNNITPMMVMDVEEQLSEQRKLVFGLLFSLRELVGSLGPEENEGGSDDNIKNEEEVVQSSNPIALHSVRTGASTLHNYETLSGLRFAMYTDHDTGSSSSTSHNKNYSSHGNNSNNNAIRDALRHVYTDIWVECVIRSPLYRHGAIPEPGKSIDSSSMIGKVDIKSTLFEKRLDEYLMSMPWFK